VSSTIVPKIFDITVSLPLPWMLGGLWSDGRAMQVDWRGLRMSIPSLLGLLLAAMVTLRLNQWTMTKAMGFRVFAMYVCFILQGVVTCAWTSGIL